MKIAIRMITGIGTPRNHSSNERILFSLNERVLHEQALN